MTGSDVVGEDVCIAPNPLERRRFQKERFRITREHDLCHSGLHFPTNPEESEKTRKSVLAVEFQKGPSGK